MVNLINNYIVEVSEYNYTLKLDLHKKDSKGTSLFKTIGYYGSLIEAIKGARSDMIRTKFSENECSLNQAIQVINEITKNFENLLNTKIEGVNSNEKM